MIDFVNCLFLFSNIMRKQYQYLIKISYPIKMVFCTSVSALTVKLFLYHVSDWHFIYIISRKSDGFFPVLNLKSAHLWFIHIIFWHYFRIAEYYVYLLEEVEYHEETSVIDDERYYLIRELVDRKWKFMTHINVNSSKYSLKLVPVWCYYYYYKKVSIPICRRIVPDCITSPVFHYFGTVWKTHKWFSVLAYLISACFVAMCRYSF